MNYYPEKVHVIADILSHFSEKNRAKEGGL